MRKRKGWGGGGGGVEASHNLYSTIGGKDLCLPQLHYISIQ